MARTNYIWDEANDTLLAETDEAGNTIAEYTHEPGQFGPLLSQRRNGHTYYHHYDGLGSTRALSDESGNVTDTYTYTAFGEPVASSGTTTNPFGYKGALGYYANPETNDFYVRRRTYSPVTARWVSVDPIGLAIRGVNGFRYVFGRPSAFVDPSGMLPNWQDALGPARVEPNILLYEGQRTCTPAQTACIARIINAIIGVIQKRLDADGSCFGKVPVQLRGAGRPVIRKKDWPKCVTCRSQLDKCVVDTLKAIRITCEELGRNQQFGKTTGQCVDSKSITEGREPTDDTCRACDDEKLKNSTIHIFGMPRSIDIEGCKRNYRSPAQSNYGDTLLHETLHNCLGSEDTGNALYISYGRESLVGFVGEFKNRCGAEACDLADREPG